MARIATCQAPGVLMGVTLRLGKHRRVAWLVTWLLITAVLVPACATGHRGRGAGPVSSLVRRCQAASPGYATCGAFPGRP